MGILWRLLAPTPVKRARRTVRKVTHPVHTATRAVTPKPVKKLQRATHPLSLAELKAEDAVVNALRGQPARRPRKSSSGRGAPAPSAPAPSAPARRPRQVHPQQPRQAREEARAVEQARGKADQELRRQQRQAEIAEHFERRQARFKERAAARQAKAAGRAAIYQMKASVRQQRKAAFKSARGPYRWPEWSLIAGTVAFIAWCVLVVIADGKVASGPGVAAVPVLLVWISAVFIAGPAVLWRRHRARQAAAVVLARVAHHPEDPKDPGGHRSG